MGWFAPSEKDTATATIEKRFWDAADQFRASSGLKSQEYSAPVLGLIFLRFAEVRFAAQRTRLEKAEARFDYLLNRPEAEEIGGKVNAAMRDWVTSQLDETETSKQEPKQLELPLVRRSRKARRDSELIERLQKGHGLPRKNR
jgi:hypothetical protein